jgi:hypothetical protein
MIMRRLARRILRSRWTRRLAVAGLLATAVAYALLVGLTPAEWQTAWRIEAGPGDEIDQLASELGLSPSYFKALVFLESSGVDDPDPRFEPGVYDQLRRVRDGGRSRYGLLTAGDLAGASDEALRNLASSWGPMQIMGYHCVEIGVNVADLRDADAVAWGVRWVDQTYGHLLREQRFDDAFHMHNAGSTYPDSGPPKTHDPRYVPRGLKMMRGFSMIGWL